MVYCASTGIIAEGAKLAPQTALAALDAERSTLYRTAYSRIQYHAASIPQATGRRDAAREIMAVLAKYDTSYEVRRYFGTFRALPDDRSAQLNCSQVQLLS